MASKIALALVLLSAFYGGGVAEKTLPGKSSTSTTTRGDDHIIKTIKTKDGNIFDCVDIHRQPAFTHPLLKNHKIQMKPSYNIKHNITRSYSVTSMESQIYFAIEGCPKGSVPIIRSTKHVPKYGMPASPLNKSNTWNSSLADGYVYHYAIYTTNPGSYHGTEARLTVYGVPQAKANQLSGSVIWIINDNGPNPRNALHAGWQVNPRVFGDTKSRIFVQWTADNYQKTGCLNQDCPGFIQVDSGIGPGSPIEPLATIGGVQYYITLSVYKDPNTGNWLLHQTNGGKDIFIGYWPKELFTSLADTANTIHWGGIVGYPSSDGGPPMGSGRTGEAGKGQASSFKDVLWADEHDKKFQPVDFLKNSVNDRSDCYRVSDWEVVPGWDDNSYGFYFGGPMGCQG